MKELHLVLVTIVSLLGIVIVLMVKPAMPPKEDVKFKTHVSKIAL